MNEDYAFRAARSEDAAAIRELVCTVLREYGLQSDPANTDADLNDVVASYEQRGGVFRVLVDDVGEIVGCGGLYPVSAEEAEIRKMYFLRHVRGHGMGRTLLEDLVKSARERGFQRVTLETASVLKEALALYRNFGFVPMTRAHLASRCDQAYVLELQTGRHSTLKS